MILGGVFRAMVTTKCDIHNVRVAFFRPGFRRTYLRRDQQTAISSDEQHGTGSLPAAGAAIDFGKAGTFALGYSEARPSRGPPTIAQDDAAGRNIVHPLQPRGPGPRSCSLRDIRRIGCARAPRETTLRAKNSLLMRIMPSLLNPNSSVAAP